MISAKEARKIEETTLSAQTISEIAMIEQDIESQAKQGKNIATYYNTKFLPQTLRVLEETGYKIKKKNDQYNEFYINISW